MNCDISPNRFNSHFISITKNLDSNLKNKPGTFLWKGPKSRYVFKYHHISFQVIQFYLNSMANKHGNYILGMDIKLLKITCPVISKSLAYVVNSSLDSGIVHDDWKKPGQHRFIKMKVKLMTKIISGQYRSLATLLKWLKALLAIKSSNISKITHLFQSTSLHIWKDIRHKPAYTGSLMIGWNR